MCGITGLVYPGPPPGGGLARHAAAARMADAIVHRGPDDGGTWVDAAAGVALGYRRLSIIDLSPAGHQPMASGGGPLRRSSSTARSTTTGSSGASWRAGGGRVPGALGHRGDARGDRALGGGGRAPHGSTACSPSRCGTARERALHLARDRLGEKPLYYGWMGDTFLFGSELKALRRHPAFRGAVDRDALAVYLRHGYVPAPALDLRGRPQAAARHAPDDRRSAAGPPARRRVAYWSAREVAERGRRDPFAGHRRARPIERARRPAARRRRAGDGRRRAARRVPLGRDRFLDSSWR